MNAWSENVFAHGTLIRQKDVTFSTERIFIEKVTSHGDIWIDEKSYFLIILLVENVSLSVCLNLEKGQRGGEIN